jgi:hypothetical protein
MASKKTDGIDLYKAAIQRICSGESVSEEVELPSGRVRLTLDENTPSRIGIEVLGGEGSGPSGSPPDPKAREFMKKMTEVVERFRSGDADSAEIPLPSGGTMELKGDPSSPGAFTMAPPDGGPVMRSVPFEVSSTPPDGYPEDLPFVADTAVSLTEMEDGSSRTLTWFLKEDPEECLKAIQLQLINDGWTQGEESQASTAHGTMVFVEFEKGEMKRTVSLSRFGDKGMVRLVEHANPKQVSN